MTAFADLHKLPEDDRINVIGNAVMKLPIGRLVGIVVDDDKHEPGKADRYLEKLFVRFPDLAVVDRTPDSPIKNVVLVRIKRVK